MISTCIHRQSQQPARAASRECPLGTAAQHLQGRDTLGCWLSPSLTGRDTPYLPLSRQLPVSLLLLQARASVGDGRLFRYSIYTHYWVSAALRLWEDPSCMSFPLRPASLACHPKHPALQPRQSADLRWKVKLQFCCLTPLGDGRQPHTTEIAMFCYLPTPPCPTRHRASLEGQGRDLDLRIIHPETRCWMIVIIVHSCN